MSLFKKLFGMIATTLPHLSAGLIITHFLINIFSYQHYLYFYLIGALSAIFPDFDILKPLADVFFKKNTIDSTYKFNFMHWPLIMVPLVFFLIFIFEPVLAVIASLNLLGYYLIDSIQSGSRGVGIQWLVPFSEDFFRFFKPYRIRPADINKYVMPLEEWLDKIVLNPKYPEFWINILFFILTLLYISI